MTTEAVMDMMRGALYTILETALPVLLVSMAIGLIVSIFQTVTQIQESTLTFVPKIVGCVLLLIFMLPWMFNVFVTTVHEFMTTQSAAPIS